MGADVSSHTTEDLRWIAATLNNDPGPPST